MDIDLDKYTKVKARAPRSERAEQVDKICKLVNKPFVQMVGLTKHLQPDILYRLYQESKGSPELWWYNFNLKYKTNNMSKIMVEKLTKFPEFRERKNRDVYLAKWCLRDIDEEKEVRDSNGNLTRTTLLDKQKRGEAFTMGELGRFGLKFASLDRSWRQVLQQNVLLRGSDYGEGEELEKRKIKELGY